MEGFYKLSGMAKRGQISIEYLILIAFIVFIVIGILGAAFVYTSSVQDRIKFNQLANFANKIIGSAEAVFYSGEPSQATISVYLPAGVNSVEINGNEIIFTIQTSSGINKVSYSSNVFLVGSITNSEGVKRIQILAQESKVVLTEG